VVFLFTEFPLRQQISCLFYFPRLRYFVSHEHTLGNLEVIIYFHFRKAISSVQGRFYADSNSKKSNSMFPSRRLSHASGCPSMSRSFEQFKVTSVWTSWQQVQTLLRELSIAQPDKKKNKRKRKNNNNNNKALAIMPWLFNLMGIPLNFEILSHCTLELI